MHLPTFAALLIPVLSAQLSAQSPESNPGTLFQHQEAYPHETIAVFGINAVGPHEAELKKTGLFRLFENSPELKQALPQMIDQIATRTGMDAMEIEALAKGGMSIALTGFRPPEHFDFMGLVELGASAAKLEGMLSMMGEPSGSVDNTQIYSVAIPPEQRISYCVRNSTLMFGSSREQVAAALDRLKDKSKPSLASSPKFRRTASELSEDTSQPLVAGYLDFTRAIDAALLAVPPESRESVNQVLQALNLRQANALGYSSMPGNGRITDHFRVSLAGEPKGILAAFAPEVGKLDAEFNRFVPLGVSSFALTHMRFDELFSQVLLTLGSYDNNIASQARMMMRQMTTQTGVDIERDLFGSLGQRVLTLQWPSVDAGSPDFAVLIELRSEVRFDGAMRKLSMLKHANFQDFQIYSASMPGMPGVDQFPGLAVGKRFLTIASTRSRLESVLKHLENPQANVRVKTLFSNQPEGTIASGWSNLSVMLESYSSLFDRLDQVADPTELDRFRITFQRLAKMLGESETSVVRNAEGLSFISRSPTGNLGGLLAAGISAASTGMGAAVVSDETGEVSVDRAEYEAFRALLTEVAVSELAHKEQIAGRYVDLQTLVDAGSMERSVLGKAKEDGVFDQGTHLIRVLLPEDTAAQADQFIVVAWPIDAGTGNVYACRQDGLPMINNLIAGSNGIEELQLRDVFAGGSFEGKLTPGWRRLETREMSAVQTTNSEDSAADWEAFQMIIAAEESGQGEAGKLIPLLDSENVELASRAAFALGKLQMTEAVPDLIKIVSTHPQMEVRRFAMSALKDMRDPRSIQTSAAALTSSDIRLRTLAADNLGRLRKEEAVDPLLGLLAGEASKASDADSRMDRVQALLSLCDIGNARSLLPAASSVGAGSKAEEEALTYMFQVLTPKLEAEEEATTLMAVLDHESVLLRRYAIQRLGEMKDSNAVPALEERLAVEGDELKPLLEAALNGMIDEGSGSSTINTGAALLRLKQWKQQAIDYWQGLAQAERNKLIAGSAGGVILFFTLIFLARRRRRQKRADNWVSSMVAPSDEEFIDEEQAYDDEGYDEEYTEEYQEEYSEEAAPAEAPSLVGLPDSAALPSGDGWESAELGVGFGDEDDGYQR